MFYKSGYPRSTRAAKTGFTIGRRPLLSHSVPRAIVLEHGWRFSYAMLRRRKCVRRVWSCCNRVSTDEFEEQVRAVLTSAGIDAA